MSLMSLLFGSRSTICFASRVRTQTSYEKTGECNSYYTFTTIMAMTPPTIRNRNIIMHVSVATASLAFALRNLSPGRLDYANLSLYLFNQL